MPPKPHTKHLFYQLGYTAWAFSLLSHLSHMLGRRLSAIIGEVAGRFYTATHSHVTEVMEKNLEILMGRKVSKNEAGQVFVNFGVTMADYIWLATQPKKSALHLAELENVKITCNEGCGAILATGHYGFLNTEPSFCN